MQPLHEIIVGNIGTMYTGFSKKRADSEYTEYCAMSKGGTGSAAGEPVTWLIDGIIYKEYTPGAAIHNIVCGIFWQEERLMIDDLERGVLDHWDRRNIAINGHPLGYGCAGPTTFLLGPLGNL